VKVALFFTYGYSLKTWSNSGTLERELKIYEELSKKHKISRERVRQIETKAFEKLQKAMLNSAKSKNLLPKN